MLFFDDFLEMLDELPAELKERSEEIRRIDMDVESMLKKNREAVNEFFEKSGTLMTQEQRVLRYNALQDEYKRIRIMAEKKYKIAKRMQDLLTKYQQHLEKEKTAFQCEMEADNSGVTEMIEKRYSEYVEALLAARKERKRRYNNGAPSRDSSNSNNTLSKESSEKIARILQEGVRLGMEQSDESNANSTISSSAPSPAPRGRPPKNPNHPNNLNVILPSAIPADANSYSSHTRRRSTNSALRNNITISNGQTGLSPNVSERSWSNQAAEETPTNGNNVSLPNVQLTPSFPAFVGSESRHGRTRKLTSRVQEMFKETLQRQRGHQVSTNTLAEKTLHTPVSQPPQFNRTVDSSTPLSTEDDEDEEESDEEDGEDSRTWCFCNEKSYGEMVACDGRGCPYQWFHYPCVGIQAPPKGKWFCPHCTTVLESSELQNTV